MAEAYPVELRERVVHAYESGVGSYPEVGAMFNVGEATVRRWTSLRRRTADEIEAIVTALGDPTALEITHEAHEVFADRLPGSLLAIATTEGATRSV